MVEDMVAAKEGIGATRLVSEIVKTRMSTNVPKTCVVFKDVVAVEVVAAPSVLDRHLPAWDLLTG